MFYLSELLWRIAGTTETQRHRTQRVLRLGALYVSVSLGFLNARRRICEQLY
jgi:hypothetical protein